MNECPLCQSRNQLEFARDKSRVYLKCLVCNLIFVPRNQLVSNIEEKKRYDAHQNSEEDLEYQNYLKELLQVILPHLNDYKLGFDFGCGRTKLLGSLLNQLQFSVASYDLYFFPDPILLEQKYDFIILSEVIEHLREPMLEMQKLRSLLNPNGKIFLKTQLSPETSDEFNHWFYKRDKTHIQFFNGHSLAFLANALKLKGPQELAPDVFCFMG